MCKHWLLPQAYKSPQTYNRRLVLVKTSYSPPISRFLQDGGQEVNPGSSVDPKTKWLLFRIYPSKTQNPDPYLKGNAKFMGVTG